MKKLIFILTMTIALIFTGCSDKGTVTPTDTVSGEAVSVTKEPVMETVSLYTISASTMQIVPIEVKKPEDDDSLSCIVNLVQANLPNLDVTVDYMAMEGGNAVISFSPDGYPIKNCTQEMESLILECFSSSVLDNAKDCHGVIFRVGNDDYKSPHMELDRDEVFASK